MQKICEQCEESFETDNESRRFCGRTCANRATAAARGAAYREAHGHVPPACPCGATIEPAPGAKSQYVYGDNKKYCSDECRAQYGKKRQKNPDNYVTFACLNCGDEVERRKKHNKGSRKYCSTTCANKHTKVRKFYAVEDFDVVFESSYEAFFWGLCMIAKIPVERFDRQYGVQWDPANPESWYAPDFWLPTYRAAIETKGVEDEDDRVKWAAYRSTRGRLMVFDSDRLGQFSPSDLDIQIRKEFDLERFPEELRFIAPK